MSDNYTRVYANGIFLNGPDEIHDAFSKILAERDALNRNSKFHEGQIVRLSDDVCGIAHMLMNAYTPYEANLIARSLAGQLVTIIAVDILTDDNNISGTYYSFEDKQGMMYCLPERFIKNI